MMETIVEDRRYNRLPEDSGEWRAVPLRVRRLPPERDQRLRRKLRRLSWANAGAQVVMLALVTWAGFELLHERDFLMLMVPATVIGLVTSAATGAWLARRYWLDAADTMGVLMRAQLWWMILLLIPIWGWTALFGLGLPCVFGSFFGTWLGAQLGNQRGATT